MSGFGMRVPGGTFLLFYEAFGGKVNKQDERLNGKRNNLGRQDLASGARTDWDIVPQMQVSLSTLQHILVSAGYRIPVTNTSGRSGQFVFYFIWDWYDGGLFDHW